MLNILFVDDEGAVSDVLGQILTRLGHRVEIASNGHEGLRMFDSRVYDLVITDILMPGIDGHGVARHIRSSDRASVPIIGISGTPWFLDGDIFDSVLPKPFSIQALTNAIDDAMRNGSKPQTLTEHQEQDHGLHGVSTSPLLAT
jgi:CheY-like chemotaxis protein